MKLTPDIIVQGAGFKFGLDVTLRRPGGGRHNAATSLKDGYRDKLKHYYGVRNGLALFHAASTTKIPTHKNDYFVNITSTSDKALILSNLTALSAADQKLLPSPLPTMPIRPIVINGVSGRLEPLSKIFLTHLLLEQFKEHHSHLSLREMKALVSSQLCSITMRLIAVTSNVRIRNHGKFLVDNDKK